jgi:hypothetical protein
MPDLIKKGFARKAIEKRTKNFLSTFFSFARSNHLIDFVFYVILIAACWGVGCVALMAGWNWFIVYEFALRPIDFVASMGLSLLLVIVFLFLYLLGEVK